MYLIKFVNGKEKKMSFRTREALSWFIGLNKKEIFAYIKIN